MVGLVVMGAAICWRLGAGGQAVVGYERLMPGHQFGSSQGVTRIIRQAYYEHPDYVPLIRRSWGRWQELERVSGRSLLTQTGGLMIGRPDGELISGTRASVQLHELRHQELSARAIEARFPQFRLPADVVGIFEHQAGVLACETSVTTLVQAARHTPRPLTVVHDQVLRLEAASDRVRVHTTQGTRDFEQVVVACGGWTSELLPELGLPLSVERQVQHWFAPPDPALFQPARLPIWMHQQEDDQMFYGIPAVDGKWAKAARHHDGASTTMNELDRAVSDQDRQAVVEATSTFLPALGCSIAASSVSCYTNTPDRNFLIGRLKTLPQVILAAGFSGHGFKFAPVIGDLVEAIIRQDAPPPPILSTTRFGL